MPSPYDATEKRENGDALWFSLPTAISGPAKCSAGKACMCSTSWARRARKSCASSSISRALPGSRIRSICRATRTCSHGSSASIRAAWCRFWSMTAPSTSRATTSSSIWKRNFRRRELIPAGHENEVAALLKHEDDLHLDLRTLSFRFVFAPPGPPKPAAALESYLANGAGTVQGLKDREKDIQIEFWQRAAEGRLHRRSGPFFGAEIPRRIRRARQETGEAALSVGPGFDRARYRLVDL